MLFRESVFYRRNLDVEFFNIESSLLDFYYILFDHFSTGGGRSIPVHLQKGIQSYLKENSNIASNRMIKVKSHSKLNSERYIPVRYLQDSKIQLFNRSPFKNIISYSTFFKYLSIDNQFKNPHR